MKKAKILSEFQLSCTTLDQQTQGRWRTHLLEFIQDIRTIIKLHEKTNVEKNETITCLILQLEENFLLGEEVIAFSDSGLRERLAEGLYEYRDQVVGDQDSKNATLGHLVRLLHTAYLD